jgi:hypothetical protein
MTYNPTLTREYVAEILDYDPETGVFTRKKSTHKNHRGTTAGGINNSGYWCIRVGANRYLAHRLAWLLVYGEMPDRMIDHINGNPLDNRIANLRMASPNENAYNRKKRSDNTSGIKGVSAAKQGLRARISVDGEMIHIGYFKTVDDAERAIREARNSLHREFSRHA